MHPRIVSLLFAAGGCVLLAQPVSAQPTVRDHRSVPVKAAPAVRDHRSAKPAPPPAKAPETRDHRTKKKPPAAPMTRDHRDKQPVETRVKVREHRDGTQVDHRKEDPVARDHRDERKDSEQIAEAGDRKSEVVPSRRGQPHKRWSAYEIPVVKRYWPSKGEAGTRVTVYGANFTPNLAILVGNTVVSGAKITPTTMTFQIPEGATDGRITARGERRNIAIGNFEVGSYNAKSELKKRLDERRKEARANWQERKRTLAKDRAARLEALQAREAELAASRAERRRERRIELRANFESAFLVDEATLAELALHAERKARLERMERLAEANGDDKLVIRIAIAQGSEQDRHSTRIATLKSAFEVQQ